MSKIKLSETLKFITGRFNAVTGGIVEISIALGADVVKTGQQLQAKATLKCPDEPRQLDYVAISLEGQVQREGKWQDFVKRAEVAQDVRLPANYEFVIPVVLHIPEDAVFSQDGGIWTLKARAVLEGGGFDPRDEVGFKVVP